ncbi:MAG: 5'-nucleotidase, lipoprotein e(P4) family [Flavobacteriales bacterium]|nr:5'-nucleotidase, lipoprotein e(P4) family [Flavobacteriales bacterium]
MKKETALILVLSIALGSACGTATKVAVTPAYPVVVPVTAPALNAGTMLSSHGTDAVLWQSTSAEAYRISQQAFELARIRLMENIQMPSPKKNAVIVDIDETVLDNSPYQIHIGHEKTTYDQASWKTWTDMSAAAAMPGAIEFLKFVEQQKCEVFYITNRDVRELASTLRNLDSLGFPFADADHLLLMDGSSDKTERRAQVSATHRVALLIGDQLRDYDERFKDRSINYGKDLVETMNDSLRRYFILLPNPMYGTFRDAVQGKGTDEEKLERTEEWFRANDY